MQCKPKCKFQPALLFILTKGGDMLGHQLFADARNHLSCRISAVVILYIVLYCESFIKIFKFY